MARRAATPHISYCTYAKSGLCTHQSPIGQPYTAARAALPKVIRAQAPSTQKFLPRNLLLQ